MTVVAAWIDGIRRVLRAPWLLVTVWMMTILLTLPAAIVLQRALEAHLGASLAAETAAAGVNFDWWNEFLAQASGLGQTFVPAIIGFAAVLKNLSSIADASDLPVTIAAILFVNLLVSVFVLGGVLDRLARDRISSAYAVLAAAGRFFFRFLRLGALAAAIYYWLFMWLHPLLLNTAYSRLTHNLTVERTAFGYRLAFYALFGAIVVAVNLLFDYAKVRMVVEDRRSALSALGAGARFIRRQPGAAVGLYLLNALLFLTVLAIYFLIAPGAAGGAAAIVGFAIAQLYILARIFVRLLFAASQIALFQGRLAHAGYTAVSEPVWPDSPAAEAVRPE